MATKITLKKTTKISLSDRFGNLRSNPPPQVASASTTRLIRHNIQDAASVKNRRLALQMERRPSVIAALKLKKKSMAARLGRGGASLAGSTSDISTARSTRSLSSRLQMRSPRGGTRGGRLIRGRGRGRGSGIPEAVLRGVQQGGSRVARKGISPLLKGRLGMANTAKPTRGSASGRGRRGRGRGQLSRAAVVQAYQAKKAQRGGGASTRSRGQRRGRGRGGRGSAQPNNVSRQDLDNDIDAYMSKTKGHLDAEIDDYMSYGDA